MTATQLSLPFDRDDADDLAALRAGTDAILDRWNRERVLADKPKRPSRRKQSRETLDAMDGGQA